MTTAKRVTIFEGPDGAGKTTAALAFARATSARYVHFPALPRVSTGLPRMYIEAMLPALLGYQDVVLDRCWLSEKPYGMAFRGGTLRLDGIDISMLERVALRGAVHVVLCMPPLDVAKRTFHSRPEMLDTAEQLEQVYHLYATGAHGLPETLYDYTTMSVERLIELVMSQKRKCHPRDIQSAGSMYAGTLLVGDSFGERKNSDPWYQLPFVSFSGAGCSRWVTKQVRSKVLERHLLWVNSDQQLGWAEPSCRQVVALGEVASKALDVARIGHKVVPHPQAWSRFHTGEPYPLLELLK